MIPEIEALNQEITEVDIPNKTYKINFDWNKLSGYADDVEALIQSIYLILNIERYKYIIYSWNYGIELFDLYGKQMPYVVSELKRRISEALAQDDRVVSVTDFEFEPNGKRLHVKFNVNSIYGTISAEKEVEI